MKKPILLLFLSLAFFSLKAQEYIDANTVNLSTQEVEDITFVYTSSLPLVVNNEKVGQYHLAYACLEEYPIFMIYIENDGGDFYKTMKSLADDLENDFEKVMLAKQQHSYAFVYGPYVSLVFPSRSYNLLPRVRNQELEYSLIGKVWDNDNESYNVRVYAGTVFVVDKRSDMRFLKESYMMKNDVSSFEIEYGKDGKIIIPLNNISTSKLISRCRKVLDFVEKSKNENL